MKIIPLYIENIAKEFWALTGQNWSPPYDISCAISLLFPVDIVSLSELSLEKIEQWLSRKNIKISINVNNRDIHGFVLLAKGGGFIFVNGTDTEEERRYTIAHEASHFILDYKIPRDKGIQKLGNSVQDLFDGLRIATLRERIDGLLSHVILEPFMHLIEKEGDGSFESIKTFDSENNADALALELLAPHSQIIKETLLGQKKVTFSSFDERCRSILISKYKLPDSIAEQYSKLLSYSITGGPSIMNKLGF